MKQDSKRSSKSTTHNPYLLFSLVISVGEHIFAIEGNAQRLDRLATCVVSRTISRESVLTKIRLSQSIMKGVVVHGTKENPKSMELRLMKATHQMNSFLQLNKCTRYHQKVIQLL